MDVGWGFYPWFVAFCACQVSKHLLAEICSQCTVFLQIRPWIPPLFRGVFGFLHRQRDPWCQESWKERNCQFGSLPCLYRNYVKLQEIIYTSKLHLYCTEHHDLSWGNSGNSQSSWSFMKHRGNIMGKSAWIAWLEHRIHSGTPLNHQRSPECPLNFLVISLP